ncbi:MAG: DUF11 domain-containing protein [Planctomycetaceae bacterium]|nr:DUF11 domain-containing protein [Planctomycetaceae bacterium]
MGALIRLVSLVGVMSAGFYVLYLAQNQLGQPDSLTQKSSAEADALSLGPGGESATAISAAKPNDEIPDLEPTTDDWSAAPQQESEPAVAMLSEETDSSEKTIVLTENAEDFSVETLDFRDTEAPATESTLVRTADGTSAATGSITLVANEDPFAEDPKSVPTELDEAPEKSTEELATEKPNPFDAADPFGDEIKSSEAVETKKEEPLKEFDPFGEDTVSSEESEKKNAPPELETDAFPALEPAPEKNSDKPTGSEKPKQLDPLLSEDPFAPLPDAKLNKPNLPEKKSKQVPDLDSQEDPFPALGLDEPGPKPKTPDKPKLTDDPFGESFLESPDTEKPKLSPEKSSSEKSLESSPSEDPFPAFPGETKEPTPDLKRPTPSLEADPFGAFPPLEEKTKPEGEASPTPTPTPTPVPSEDPFGEEVPTKTEPREETDDFPSLSEEPKASAPQSEELTNAPKIENNNDPFGNSDPFGTPVAPSTESEEKPKPLPKDLDSAEPPVSEAPFPSLEPLESSPEEAATEQPQPSAGSNLDSLPDVNEFPELDEKLKSNAKEIELKPVPKVEDVPEELPEPNSEPNVPGGEPEGQIPSLTELRGDGVMKPDTPREMKLPYLEITKQAPPKAVLNRPFVYTILVKNVGDVAANEVTVQDQIPKGSNLTGTIPQAELVGRRLVWKLGRIEPGQDQKIAVRIVPVEPGPLGSVATVNFVAEVGAETVIEPPNVTFEMQIPDDAKVGEIVDCRFAIENHGQDVVSGIVLRDIIPAGLHHPAGSDLENPLGDLKPGQKISEVLQLKVMKPGRHSNEAILTAEGGLKIRKSSTVNAVGNRLTVTRRGPKEQFVGRPAIYQNIVTNKSKDVVKDSVVVETLPPGMQFERADSGGQYHAASREIHWRIPELAPGQSLTLQSRLIPTQTGSGESLVRVLENQGEEIQMVSHTKIRSYASIGLDVTQLEDPILAGDTVDLRIEATNRGNAAAQNVEVRAKIPPSLELLEVRGETRYRVDYKTRELVFEPLQALAAGETELIELEVRATTATPAKVSVSIQSREMTKPLMKASAIEVHQRQ